MNKSKIWQIVLLALLVLAIAAILLFNNKLNASKETLSNTLAELSKEQENSAALQDDLAKAKDEYDAVSAQLTDAQAEAEKLSGEVESGKAASEKLQSDLTAANEKVSALETASAEKDAAIKEKDAAIEGLNAAVAEKDALIKEKDAAIEGLNAAVNEKGATIESLSAALGELNATVDNGTSGSGEQPESKPGENPDALVPNPQTDAPEAKPGDTPEAPAETPQLAAAQAEIEVLMAQLAEQQSAAGGEPAVDLEAVKANVDAVVHADPADKSDEDKLAELQTIRQQLMEQVPQDAMTDVVEDMQQKLEDAEGNIAQLSADLQQKQAAIDELNGQIEALNGQAEADAAQLETLQAQLADAQSEAETQAAELAEKTESYEKQVAALEAYKVTREPAAGEAHTATAVGNVVEIESDGVTGTWEYSNSDISGNPIALSLLLDDAEIFAAKLQPGESLDGITLNAPVAAGTYQAMAVTTVVDADGEDQLTTRVPVTLHVAG